MKIISVNIYIHIFLLRITHKAHSISRIGKPVFRIPYSLFGHGHLLYSVSVKPDFCGAPRV